MARKPTTKEEISRIRICLEGDKSLGISGLVNDFKEVKAQVEQLVLMRTIAIKIGAVCGSVAAGFGLLLPYVVEGIKYLYTFQWMK